MELINTANIPLAILISYIIKTLIDSIKLYIPGKRFIFILNIALSFFCVLSFDVMIFNCKYTVCSYLLTGAFIASGAKSIYDLLDLIGVNNTKTPSCKIDTNNIVWMGQSGK